MTPKEKAKELVDKYFKLLNYEFGDEVYSLRDKQPHKCALIAVDEIISSREDDGAFDDTLSSMSEYYTPHPMYLTYWEQVKQEIQKL